MTDRQGCLKLFSAIQMMQDCSEFWKESEPAFRDCLVENDAAQLLVFRQVEVLRVPCLYEKLTCSSSVFDCKGANGYRNTIITDEAGEPCYVSWSQGAFVNTTTGRLFRVPVEVLEQMQMEPRYAMHYRPRKIELPRGNEIPMPSIPVQHNDIDYNQHVNNAQYIRMALEYVPDDFEIATMRVEYKRAVRYGSSLQPSVLEMPEALYIILREEDSVCCIVEFTRLNGATLPQVEV